MVVLYLSDTFSPHVQCFCETLHCTVCSLWLVKKQHQAESCFFYQPQTTHCSEVYTNAGHVGLARGLASGLASDYVLILELDENTGFHIFCTYAGSLDKESNISTSW